MSYSVNILLSEGESRKDLNIVYTQKKYTVNKKRRKYTMKDIYFTITGMNHCHGNEFLETGTEVKLVKEPDNKYDKEAIKIVLPGLDKIGYVANSTYTVIGESYSAGRIYDKIGDEARGTVLYKLSKGVVCRLDPESIKTEEIVYQDDISK